MALLTIAETEEDLQGILDLQSKNLKIAGTDQVDGYVTAVHDLEVLLKMNSPFPYSIMKVENQVVGYALVMLPERRNELEILIPMFNKIDTCTYDGHRLIDQKYFVMGQICISSRYRSKGYFSRLYSHLICRLRENFDFIITEVDALNRRSLGAHMHYGFEVLLRYQANGIDWKLLIKRIGSGLS